MKTDINNTGAQLGIFEGSVRNNGAASLSTLFGNFILILFVVRKVYGLEAEVTFISLLFIGFNLLIELI